MTEQSEIMWEIETDEDGYRFEKYYCTKDRQVLWIRYLHNDVEVIVNDCEHYYWEPVGSGCYPDPLDEEICAGIDETVRQSIKKVYDGSTIYFLIPRQS